jgi:glutamine---fructose-6-phosphate transaminase (isomerizing)
MPGSSVRSTHTLAEILSQPGIWRTCLIEAVNSDAYQSALSKAADRKEWLFVGCGTSFYLAEAASIAWTLLTGLAARAMPASEVLLFPHAAKLDTENLQTVIISRSGHTSEAVRAAEALKRKHQLPTLGVTCALNSELARACEATITLPSADEKSMVMTRSFTSMLRALVHLAAASSGAHEVASALEIVTAALSSRIQDFNDRIHTFVSKHAFEDYVYLAQGPFYPIAREAALKVTEMSCSYAQPYHTLEFRHGPKSIVSPRTCLTFFLSESGREAEGDVLVEMKGLGGTIITVCNRASEPVRRASDLLFELEVDVAEPALLAPFIVPGQLLGFHTGVKKGLNPDEPKNLSRVVVLD